MHHQIVGWHHLHLPFGLLDQGLQIDEDYLSQLSTHCQLRHPRNRCRNGHVSNAANYHWHHHHHQQHQPGHQPPATTTTTNTPSPPVTVLLTLGSGWPAQRAFSRFGFGFACYFTIIGSSTLRGEDSFDCAGTGKFTTS